MIGELEKQSRLCSIFFLGRLQPDRQIRLLPSKIAGSDVRASCGATAVWVRSPAVMCNKAQTPPHVNKSREKTLKEYRLAKKGVAQ